MGIYAVAPELYNKVNKKVFNLSTAPESQFKTSLLYGKEKMTSIGRSSSTRFPTIMRQSFYTQVSRLRGLRESGVAILHGLWMLRKG